MIQMEQIRVFYLISRIYKVIPQNIYNYTQQHEQILETYY